MSARALLIAILCSVTPALFAAEPAALKPPDRRELWVPVDKLGFVLDANAVLLTREQYETLLRDAEREKNPKVEAPVAAVTSSAEYRAVPEGKTAVIHAELLVNVLRDGWCEVPLDFSNGESHAAIGEVKIDGEGILTPRNPFVRGEPPAPAMQQKAGAVAAVARPALLLLRGRGEHRVTLEISRYIGTDANGVSGFFLNIPPAAAGVFTLTLPRAATMEESETAMRVTKNAEATQATVALSPSRKAVEFAWKAGADNDAKIPVRAQALVRFDIDAEKVAGSYRLHLEAPLGDLPLSFKFALPAGVKVLAVRAEELRGWEAADGKIVAKFQDGSRKELDLEIAIELPPVIAEDAAATLLPMPVLLGASRLDGVLQIAGADNVIIMDVTADARMRRMPTAEDRGERGFFGAYEFSGSSVAPKVVIARAEPGLESDLDTLVEFRADAIFITRTLTLREQKGRRFSAALTLPGAEELIEVRRIEEVKAIANQPSNSDATESEPEWTRDGGRVLIQWSDEAKKPRVFRVRTRIEPEKWTQLPPEGISLTLGDAKIAGSAKVTGYIALTADPAFRIEAQPGETLERRDGRSTPVRGEYAWFRRDEFDLTIKIARRPSEVLAALTGYVLPLEGLLDVRASMNYQFMGGGTRAVRIRVPKDLAQNFHFEGPQIAERALDGDVWTVTFQKELTGAYALSIAAQVPVAKQAGDGKNGTKGYSFAVRVPVISPLDVVRASGLWAVEANTETEIRFEARGMNELDSLLAPQLADYAPRHRVIGVFGWLGADYALTLNGVRHAPAGMLAAVVDALELNTVISTSGLHRHEAVYRLRSTGVEYLDVTLPPGAVLLSVAIDGTAVKPVADRPGNVRLPLPARRDADAPVVASITYETAANAWQKRGTLALAAPSLAKGIPVLKSAWHVWVPDGFSYSEFESNLPVREELAEELLVRTIPRVSLDAIWSLRGPPVFVSTGQLMVSGQLRTGDSSAAYSEELVNFFGTQIVLMESEEVSKGARARVRSLHPQLAEEEVKLQVGGLPKNGIFELRVTGKSPEYAKAFLDACMDEYIAKKKEMRANKQEGTIVAIQDELVRLEKDMQTEEEEMRAFQKSNNIGFLKEDLETTGTEIAGLKRQAADLTTELESLAPMQNVPANKNRSDAIRIQIKSLGERVKESEAKAQALSRRIADWDKIRSKIDKTKAQYDRLNGGLRAMDVYKNLDQDTVAILAHASMPKGAPGARMAATEMAAAGEGRRDHLESRNERAAAAMTPPPAPARPTDAITERLNAIIVPKIDFQEVTVREAFQFIVAQSRVLDASGRGVNIVLNLGDDGGGNGTRITLLLKDVPLIEVIKYVTNLANLKYKIEAHAVTIAPIGWATEELFLKQWKVPASLFAKRPDGTPQPANQNAADGSFNAKDFLSASGVTFGQGAFATYSPANGALIVKATQDQLELIQTIIESGGAVSVTNETAAAGGIAGPAVAKPRAGSADLYFESGNFGRRTAGLLPVTLDLPKSGRVLVFEGLYAPERLVMRYDDWWSRARALWLWFVAGGVAFYLLAARRPWWRTLWAMLVLSALPLCVSAAWMPVCNAVLGGWLAGLVLNRIGAWCVFRERKEVLA